MGSLSPGRSVPKRLTSTIGAGISGALLTVDGGGRDAAKAQMHYSALTPIQPPHVRGTNARQQQRTQQPR